MSLEEGCKVAVETCMGITDEDKVVIASDEDSEEIGKCLRKAALEVTPQVRYFKLELYGKRPLSKIPEAIIEAARNATVTFWTGKSIKGELETVRRPFINAALIGGRHAHMVDIDKKIMENGMAADYHEVERVTTEVKNRLEDTKNVRVENELGTKLESYYHNVKWVASTGISRTQGHWINLPSGEVFTSPTDIKGKLVCDGVLGDYLGDMFHHKDLIDTPITVEIGKKDKERSGVLDLKCENEELLNELEEYFALHECSSWVGETGFGTNIFLDSLIDNMLQDEKFPGVHVAFGDPINSETYAGWTCPEHLDFVLTKCNVWFDDEKVMEDGEWMVEY